MIIADIIMALWIGILVSISPCPLANNIASISFISNKLEKPKETIKIGILYAIGRVLAYWILAILIIKLGLSIPLLANFLTNYIKIILAIILILTGILLLDIIDSPFRGLGGLSLNQEKQEFLIKHLGKWSALPLGFIFSLAFCPISAGLFFGSLIPLAIKNQSIFFIPAMFGVGTALIVVSIAFILFFSLASLGRIFNKITFFELCARRITAVIFLILGIILLLQ